jgi:hypothetical protein
MAKTRSQASMVITPIILLTQEAEAGGSWVWGQHWLYSKSASKQKNTWAWCFTPIIPDTSEAEIIRMTIQGQPRQLSRPYLTRRQWLMPSILATQEVEIRSIAVQCQPGQIVQETLSWKNSSQKRAGGVAQVVECLPRKCEVLSSSPNTTKNERAREHNPAYHPSYLGNLNWRIVVQAGPDHKSKTIFENN